MVYFTTMTIVSFFRHPRQDIKGIKIEVIEIKDLDMEVLA